MADEAALPPATRRPRNTIRECCSVILPDVTKRLIEEILIFDLVLHIDYLAEGFLDLPFSGFRALPTREANEPNNSIDIGDDPLHDHRSLPVLGFGEQLGQRRLRLGLLVHGIYLLLGLDAFLGQRQQLFEKLYA